MTSKHDAAGYGISVSILEYEEQYKYPRKTSVQILISSQQQLHLHNQFSIPTISLFTKPQVIFFKMQFLTAATLFAASAFAAPAPQTTDCPNPAHCGGNVPKDPSTYENVDIENFSLRKNPGITNASFKLSSTNGTAECEIGAVEKLPSEVVSCGDSAYRFGLFEADDASQGGIGLRLYKQTSQFFGMVGEGRLSFSGIQQRNANISIGSVPTYCRAGGNGPDDFVCDTVPNTYVTIVIEYPQ